MLADKYGLDTILVVDATYFLTELCRKWIVGKGKKWT
jgi:hypothetical protein